MLWIKSLPCSVPGCHERDIEAAHVGSTGKCASRKCIDTETAPLCGFGHHREGKESHHKLGRRFWEFHGIDRDALIAELNERYAKEHELQS